MLAGPARKKARKGAGDKDEPAEGEQPPPRKKPRASKGAAEKRGGRSTVLPRPPLPTEAATLRSINLDSSDSDDGDAFSGRPLAYRAAGFGGV